MNLKELKRIVLEDGGSGGSGGGAGAGGPTGAGSTNDMGSVPNPVAGVVSPFWGARSRRAGRDKTLRMVKKSRVAQFDKTPDQLTHESSSINTDIYKNPTAKQWKKIPYGVRAYLHKSGDLYVGSHPNVLHYQIAREADKANGVPDYREGEIMKGWGEDHAQRYWNREATEHNHGVSLERIDPEGSESPVFARGESEANFDDRDPRHALVKTHIKAGRKKNPGVKFLTMNVHELNPYESLQEADADTGLSDEDAARYASLGEMQRGSAEDSMVKAQRALGGGVLSFAIEHGGDVIHRMNHTLRWGNTAQNLEIGRQYTLEKTDKVLHLLKRPYGFKREHEENMASNARYRGIPHDEFTKQAHAALDAYANEHAKLPAYNRLHRYANKAAESLGRRDFDSASRYYGLLHFAASSPERYKAAMKPDRNESLAGSGKIDYGRNSEPAPYVLYTDPTAEEIRKVQNFHSKIYKSSKEKGRLIIDHLNGHLHLIGGAITHWDAVHKLGASSESAQGLVTLHTKPHQVFLHATPGSLPVVKGMVQKHFGPNVDFRKHYDFQEHVLLEFNPGEVSGNYGNGYTVAHSLGRAKRLEGRKGTVAWWKLKFRRLAQALHQSDDQSEEK